MLLWLLMLPIAVLGVGFSNFEILSPLGFVKDVAALPSAWGLVSARLTCWLYLIWPVASYYILVRRNAVRA
jgi:hypothetical protein